MTPEKALQLADIGFKFEVKPRKKDRADGGQNLERAAQRASALSQRASLEDFTQQDEHEGKGDSKEPTHLGMAMEQQPGAHIEAPPQEQLPPTLQGPPIEEHNQQLQPTGHQHYGPNFFYG